MQTTPTVEDAATWFNAKTVTCHLDVVDTRADDVSMRFEPLFPFADVQVGPNCEIGAVSVIEETDTTSDEPWLVIVEPC